MTTPFRFRSNAIYASVIFAIVFLIDVLSGIDEF